MWRPTHTRTKSGKPHIGRPLLGPAKSSRKTKVETATGGYVPATGGYVPATGGYVPATGGYVSATGVSCGGYIEIEAVIWV